jgi:hypothetical protein
MLVGMSSVYDEYADEGPWAPASADFEAMDEAAQWRVHEEVVAYVDLRYGFATGWRRDELIEWGEDALSGLELWGLVAPDRECLTLGRDGELALSYALSKKWQEMCDWRRDMSRPARLPWKGTPRVRRAVPRPRARRDRRSRVTSRAGPDDEPGESDPPRVARSWRVPTARFDSRRRRDTEVRP